MKLFSTCLLLLLSLVSAAQENKAEKPRYEMKQYYFVLLTKGPVRTQDSATAAQIQAGHMSNMEKMAEMGKLQVAGPFTDDGNWRGIFIFDAESREEVEKLLQTDPAITSGRLSYEIHPWMTAKGTTFK